MQHAAATTQAARYHLQRHRSCGACSSSVLWLMIQPVTRVAIRKMGSRSRCISLPAALSRSAAAADRLVLSHPVFAVQQLLSIIATVG